MRASRKANPGAKAARPARVKVVHWNESEAWKRARKLEDLGYEVDARVPDGPPELKRLAADPPDAIVIDLARLPSQGRDFGLALRHVKGTRHVPLVFVGGEPGKVGRTRELLPDATFTDWRRIRGSLARAISSRPVTPVVPESRLAGYSGTPLAKKLGIKAGSVVVLVGAPPRFAETLSELPPGVVFRERARGPADLAIWFASSSKVLRGRIRKLAALAEGGALWIAWPKKASGVETDLSEQVVRETGLANGLVDYKICAIDETWSGLKFAVRRGVAKPKQA